MPKKGKITNKNCMEYGNADTVYVQIGKEKKKIGQRVENIK